MTQTLFQYISFHRANKMNTHTRQTWRTWGTKKKDTSLQSRSFRSSGKRHVRLKIPRVVSTVLTIVWNQCGTMVAENIPTDLQEIGTGQSHQLSVWEPGLPALCHLMSFNLGLTRGRGRCKRQTEAKAGREAQEISMLRREHLLPTSSFILETCHWGDAERDFLKRPWTRP